jgi:hypothetical protein
LNFTIKLEQQFTLTERVIQRINIGKRVVLSLNTGISTTQKDLSYLCVSVLNAQSDEDLTPGDNEYCLTLWSEKTIVEPPFPNPTKDIATVRAILKTAGSATLTVADMSGQKQLFKVFPDLEAGLQVFSVDISNLDAGTYLIYITHPSGRDEFKVMKE